MYLLYYIYKRLDYYGTIRAGINYSSFVNMGLFLDYKDKV